MIGAIGLSPIKTPRLDPCPKAWKTGIATALAGLSEVQQLATLPLQDIQPGIVIGQIDQPIG